MRPGIVILALLLWFGTACTVSLKCEKLVKYLKLIYHINMQINIT